jgi:predicted Zn-dependent peptidase
MSARSAYLDAKQARRDALELVASSLQRIGITEERFESRTALLEEWRNAIERSRKLLAAPRPTHTTSNHLPAAPH